MKICIAAPIAVDDVRAHLGALPPSVPVGYTGAPLTGVLIGELLRAGHEVLGLTIDIHRPLGSAPVVLRGPRFELQVLAGRPRAWRFNGWQPGRVVDLFRIERAQLAQAMRAARPDLVHAHWTYEFALAAIDSGLPHVITAHDSPRQVLRFSRSPYRALRWWMAREVYRRGRCFTTVSSYMADECHALRDIEVAVVPNPVAAHVLGSGGVRSAPAARRVAMVSNGWSVVKNPMAALRGFAAFRAQSADAELHLFGVGYGPGEQAEHWACEQGLAAGVHFHGAQPHRRLTEQLATMDALLHPALEESFGVVLAEAMALGLPVVAGHQSGAVPWVVGQGGVLTDVRDPAAIAAALARVFDGSAFYGQCSAAAHARANLHFTPASVAQQYLSIYHGQLPGRPGLATAAACPTESSMS